ncbi:MAG: DUF2157 domain-containing protein [Cytophagaceae bacterium]|nr:DUF2157 domain-containing protein [Cytophagaceae bacterium]
MHIKKDLAELVDASVISQETADNIQNYYTQKEDPPQNKLFVIFAILGALLVGLGIILIIAHNWDELSTFTKTILAFVPLVFSQMACGYALIKKSNDTSWRESSATLLVLSIGASIALISQIYNIPGNISDFLLTWLLLSLPVVYLLQSSFTSLLYLTGVTVYAAYSNYWTYPHAESYWFWLLLLAILPYYYSIFQRNKRSHVVLIHHWFVAVALIICLGTAVDQNEGLIALAYMNLFCVFTLSGHMINLQSQSQKSNGYISIGQTLSLLLLLASTFHDFWQSIIRNNKTPSTSFGPEFIAVCLTGLLATGLLLLKKIKFREDPIKPLETVFLYFTVIYIFSFVFPSVAAFTNILFLLLCILIIREGIKKEHLGITNLGLLMITALVACRFFDTDLQFAVRGALFLFVGIGFFVTNFIMIKKRNG